MRIAEAGREADSSAKALCCVGEVIVVVFQRAQSVMSDGQSRVAIDRPAIALLCLGFSLHCSQRIAKAIVVASRVIVQCDRAADEPRRGLMMPRLIREYAK